MSKTRVTSTLVVLCLSILIVLFGLDTSSISKLDGSSSSTVGLVYEGFLNAWRNDKVLNRFTKDLYNMKTPPLTGKVYLITGATRGLGHGLALHVLALGGTLILPYRKLPDNFLENLRLAAVELKETYGQSRLATFPEVFLVQMDLADFDSIEAGIDQISKKFKKIDVLVNNAGLLNYKCSLSAQGFELTFAVNFLGAVHLTQLLLEKGLLDVTMDKGDSRISRVISITSEEHRLSVPMEQIQPFGNLTCTGLTDCWELYAISKLFQTAYFVQLGKRFSSDELVVIDVCPGPVGSDIVREDEIPLVGGFVKWATQSLFRTPIQASLPILRYAISDYYKNFTGEHFHMAELRKPREDVRNETLRKWMWLETQKLIERRKPYEL